LLAQLCEGGGGDFAIVTTLEEKTTAPIQTFKVSDMPRFVPLAVSLENTTAPTNPKDLLVSPPRIEIDLSKAAKDDDARIPVELWDKRIWNKFPSAHASAQSVGSKSRRCPLLVFCDFFLRSWRKWIAREVLSHLRVSKELTTSLLEGARECLEKSTEVDWWEWRGGSRLYFWHWPKPHQEHALRGHPVFVKGELPRYKQPQPKEQDVSIRDKVRDKLNNVRDKGNIKPGKVRSLTGYFGVPKGLSDIRMVYDATRSGLNEALWATNFGLPTVETHLRGFDFGSWMGDIDLGEMFLHFCLDIHLHEFCGVDLTPYLDGPNRTRWEWWVRCLMGSKVLPYLTIKGLLLGLEWILGDPEDCKNVFRWSKVCLNLPGAQQSYNSLRPWVSKVRGDKETEEFAALLVSYVDDLRVAGLSQEECWNAMHHVSSRLGYLGLQFAARKTRPPSLSPGPWAGSVVNTTSSSINVCCTLEKWLIAKKIVKQLREAVGRKDPLNHKELERDRGFLVHVQHTYPAITPYLKGIHLTIDSWRIGRDEEGWKSTSIQNEE
jgi:hypothetical protein